MVVTAEHALGRVGAYRGGVWCWVDDARMAVVTAEGALAVIGVHGGAGIVVAHDGHAAAPVAWPGGLLFASERDDALEVVEVPAAVLAGGAPAGHRWSTADFAWDPAVSPNGRWVAWHEWDLTVMSWTNSRIVLTDREVGAPSVVAGGDGISVGQPRFSPDGARLAYMSDESGWWNVQVARADGTAPRPLLDETHDHAEPAWGPGQRSFAWSPDSNAIAVCRNEDGFARLITVSLDGVVTEVAKGWHHGMDWGPRGVVAVRSGAKTPPQITVCDPATGEPRVVARGAPAGIEIGAREPTPVTWASAGLTVPGLLYPPDNANAGGPPPMLVDVHGGPTGQATVAWDGWLRYFTSRGWAVLRPNYRGSTGYGRPFVQCLHHTWGLDDVEDVAAGIRAAAELGWCDPNRVAVAGGSAGGLTALLVCAKHPHLVRAGVSAYGVTDLVELAATTHRFESRYLDELVGEFPRDVDRYRDQSPVTFASQIQVPLLVLHGDDDKVVPPRQAELVVDAVRAAGGHVDHHVYSGEGHGWSKIETVQDELERTLAFLEEWVIKP